MISTFPENSGTSRFTPSQKIAKSLLKIGAIQFNVANPFTWTSGIKSPIYCDNRLINSDVAVRSEVVDALVNLIELSFPEVELIAGVATGGIPIGVLIADRLNLPFIYVRGEAKKYGLKRQIEGKYQQGDKVILFEDHISTGGSSLNAAKALREAGLTLVSLLSVMTYKFKKTEELYKREAIVHESLCDLAIVMETALKEGTINEKEQKLILEFMDSL